MNWRDPRMNHTFLWNKDSSNKQKKSVFRLVSPIYTYNFNTHTELINAQRWANSGKDLSSNFSHLKTGTYREIFSIKWNYQKFSNSIEMCNSVLFSRVLQWWRIQRWRHNIWGFCSIATQRWNGGLDVYFYSLFFLNSPTLRFEYFGCKKKSVEIFSYIYD